MLETTKQEHAIALVFAEIDVLPKTTKVENHRSGTLAN
jgi:hypothetical protein